MRNKHAIISVLKLDLPKTKCVNFGMSKYFFDLVSNFGLFSLPWRQTTKQLLKNILNKAIIAVRICQLHSKFF